MSRARAGSASLDVVASRERPEALASLYRIAEAVNADLDPDRILQAVTDEATGLVGAQFGAYFSNVEDESGPTYQLSTLAGGDREAFSRFPRPRATPIFAPTFRGDGPLRLDDVTADPRYGTMEPHHGMPPGHPPVHSYLAVPVVARTGEVLGGLFFGHSDLGVFDEHDERHAVVVARHAALAVEKARRFVDEQRARREAEATSVRLALLQTLTAELASARDVTQVATALVASSEVGLGAASTVIYLANAGRLAPVHPHSFRADVVERFGLLDPADGFPVTDAYRERTPVFCGSVAERDRRWPRLVGEDPGETRAWAAVPLVSNGAAHGVVVFGWHEPQTFAGAERGFLAAVAHQCGQALERARLYESLRDNATTLQASLLPPRIQAPHGLQVATRYRPVEQGAQVGGDFYDLFQVAPGRWGIVIGDVSGKGVRAASLTALARHTVRAAARSEPRPGLVLGVLNDELMESEQDHFCTVAY
ncbi:MAG: GAF domain-containing protein, partial [Actinomycetes bacterium]